MADEEATAARLAHEADMEQKMAALEAAREAMHAGRSWNPETGELLVDPALVEAYKAASEEVVASRREWRNVHRPTIVREEGDAAPMVGVAQLPEEGE